MGVETNYDGIDDLNAAWPTAAGDPVSQGPDHLRGLKKTLQAGFGGDGTRADVKHAGAVVLRSVAGGISWLLSSIERGRVTVTALGELFIEASSASGVLGLRAKDAAGTTRPVWVLTALAAGSQLYHAAGAVLTTISNGVAVRSGSGADPVLGFQTAAGVDRGNISAFGSGVVITALTGTAVTLGPAGVTGVAVGVTSMSAGNRAVTNVANPTGAQDAATKAYADGLVGGAGAKTLALGLLTPPGTSKLKGCTVAKISTGRWTVTLTTALSAVGNACVLATCGGGTGVPTETGLASYTVTSTTTVDIWTREVNDAATLVDLPVSFKVIDIGP